MRKQLKEVAISSHYVEGGRLFVGALNRGIDTFQQELYGR